jgi:hypothetical protein
MKKMTPLIISIISAILLILAAWSQHQLKEDERKEKNIQKQKAQENENKAQVFQNELLEKTNSLDAANIEVQNLQRQLLEKTQLLLSESKNVSKVQEESIKFMTGDGAPTVKFFSKSDGSISPIIYNLTKYPIYDLRIRIDDYDEIVKCKSIQAGELFLIDKDCIDKYYISEGPFFIAPSQTQSFNYDIKKSSKTRHYRIQLITRKKIYTYLCVVLNNDRFIKFRIRTCTTDENQLLKMIDETSAGLDPFNESYWNQHLYADKKIYSGPLEQDLKYLK